MKYSAKAERASYANLQTCGSVWHCPCCSSKVAEHRRAELVSLVEAHKSTGGTVLLGTRTFSHSRQHVLADLLDQLSVAEKRYKAGKVYHAIRRNFGFVGTVRSLETTYGVSGWHPHIHELIFLEREIDANALGAALYFQWRNACLRAGLPLPSRQHGVDVRDGSYAAAYASKWGLEAELTKAQVKRGKGSSLSPFDLLRVAAADMDTRARAAAAALFMVYGKAFKGRRQLVWSPGLRDLYAIPEDKSDDEVAAAADPASEVVGFLPEPVWKAVRGTGKRGILLEVVAEARGNLSAADDLLGQALQDYSSMQPDQEKPRRPGPGRPRG